MRLFGIAEARESFPRVALHRPPVKKLIEIVGKTFDVFKTSSTSPGLLQDTKFMEYQRRTSEAETQGNGLNVGNYEIECFV